MKTFFRKGFLFSLPFLFIVLFVFTIDPYNFFFNHNFISNDIKFNVVNRNPKSMPRGSTLWKYIDFKKNPCSNVIIGDSRTYDIDISIITKITGEKYYNFGVPGGNCKSLIQTFWYVSENTELDKVYLQISFHTYSATNNYDLMSDAEKVCNKPYLFFTRTYFFIESLLDLSYQYFGIKSKTNKPSHMDDVAWRSLLESQGREALQNMVYPTEYYVELKKISDYCKTNQIKLYIIVFPYQIDFHQLIDQYLLDETYMRYKRDMNSLGTVYDFDSTDSELTRNRSFYRDPYHLNIELIDTCIISSIWRN